MDNAEPTQSKGSGTRDLTTGSIAKNLLAMAGPMMLGMMALTSVNVVDTFFVGQLGTRPLAAMGFAFPMMFFAIIFANGIGSGVQSVVSRAIGDNDPEKARRIALHGLMLAIGLSLGLVAIGLIWMIPIFELLGADSTTMPYIQTYMRIWFLGLIFFVTPMVAGSALMATGDALSPTAFLIGGAVLNGILDPLLIFGLGPFPELGMAGAALASTIARGCITVATLTVLWRNEIFRPRLAGLFDHVGQSWREIARVGVPVTVTGMVFPVTLAVVTRVVSSYGLPAVAAYAAGSRIDGLSLLVAGAVGMGLAPIVGQNWGAGLYQRVMDAFKLSKSVALAWGAASWAVLAATATFIAPAFVDGAEAAEFLALYLMVIPVRYGADGVRTTCQQVLHAIDLAFHSTVLTVAHGVVLAATTLLAAALFDLPGVFGAIVFTDVLMGFAAWRHVVGVLQKRKK